MGSPINSFPQQLRIIQFSHTLDIRIVAYTHMKVKGHFYWTKGSNGR